MGRCLAYGAAGADMVFPAGVRAPSMAGLSRRLPHPICAVDSPGSSVAQEEAVGIKALRTPWFAVNIQFIGKTEAK